MRGHNIRFYAKLTKFVLIINSQCLQEWPGCSKINKKCLQVHNKCQFFPAVTITDARNFALLLNSNALKYWDT